MGTVIFDKNGMPTDKSLDAIKEVMSREYGQDKFVASVYDRKADAQKIIDFALDRQKNTEKYPYSINPFGKNKFNVCDTFAKDALKAGRR